MNIPINFVCEDALSEFVMIKLVNSFGDKFCIGTSYNGGGYGYIKKNIKGFNMAAITMPFFVLTDLDNVSCPLYLINTWLPRPKKQNLIFRVAIREIEAWILADIEGFSKFLGVSRVHFPSNPESVKNPKSLLIKLAKKSRKRNVREDIVPLNSNARIGPNYNDRLRGFVLDEWDVSRAKIRSSSLSRAFDCLQRFQYVLPNP
jgi:hypothetical protein